jgi:hypothetical protein
MYNTVLLETSNLGPGKVDDLQSDSTGDVALVCLPQD